MQCILVNLTLRLNEFSFKMYAQTYGNFLTENNFFARKRKKKKNRLNFSKLFL